MKAVGEGVFLAQSFIPSSAFLGQLLPNGEGLECDIFRKLLSFRSIQRIMPTSMKSSVEI